MNCCTKHLPKKPVIIKNKYACKCQGLCLIKEFSKRNEDKCQGLEVSGPSYKTKAFPTGSSYKGDWSPGCGMQGSGVYTFANGVIYEGEFKDGAMHGKGELRYQTHTGQAIVRGIWKDGIMTERTILFDDDTLEYEENDWQYCKMPDRRYSQEYADGMQPGGRSFLTAYQPPKPLHGGCYDTGDGLYDTEDGIYDHNRQMIYDHGDLTRIIRGPSIPEKKWIKENCRMGDKTMTIGPRPDFYEKYVEPTVLLEPNPLPAAKYKEKIRKQSTFDEESKIGFWPREVYRKAYDSAERGKPVSTVIDSAAKLVINN